ncbi:hypothetical protein [Pantoea sp. BAV 3049]|uniref:hypothetical protein n=1 Tax=Pantoea sp. BAV 3049 TaxID=2654188 RepID=UPI00131EA7BD|nr:hypothetical protein [Pantoea sp. BAV 3049]
MDNAEGLARRMLRSLDINNDGFFKSVLTGALTLPTNLAYLGYEYFDTENRYSNANDHHRIAELIKDGIAQKTLTSRIIFIIIKKFMSEVDEDKLKNEAMKLSGGFLGKIAVSELTGISLSKAVTSGLVKGIVAGSVIGLGLSIGAESSRAIYTFRRLEQNNHYLYYLLRKAGNLDLAYFLVEDKMSAFVDACNLKSKNKNEFDKVCEYFFSGL